MSDSANTSLPVFHAAKNYLQRGWRVIPVPPRQKAPVLSGRQNLRLSQADIRRFFSNSSNIGTLLGEPSGWLVDVDLDSPLAARLAPAFLPATGAIFGRASKPRSHWLFYSPNAKTAKWQTASGMLVELRSAGCQTIFPPSVHPSGEAIEWASEGEPARVSEDELKRAYAKLAAAVLLALVWPKGARQDAALALAGGLLRAGWSEGETRNFIQAVAGGAGDEEAKKRAEAVVYTARKAGHSPTTGWPRLAELVGQEVVHKVREWLQIPETAKGAVGGSVQLWNAQELLNADFPEPSWLVPGLLPEGGLAVLAGKPKIGKSWLAFDLAAGVSSGGSVCGVPVAKQVNVLYLALEDTPRRLKSRMLTAGFTPGPGCFIATSWPRLNTGGLEELEEAVKKANIGLVVIDTFAKVRPVRGKVVSLYADDYEALSGLKELADRLGITILVVHHLRKAMSDDPLEEISGTTGLTGAVDTVLVLKRGRGEADGTLFLTGRDCEERETALSFAGGRWQVLGDAEEYAMSRERRQVLELLQAAGEPLGPKEIAAELGKPEGAVKMLLFRMTQDGLLQREGRGRYSVAETNKKELPELPSYLPESNAR